MMYFGDHMSGWAWVFMGFGSVLFWAALMFGIVVLVRYWKGSNPAPTEPFEIAEDEWAALRSTSCTEL